MSSLCCEDCNKPILADELPVVLEWGKRKDGLTFLGLPIQRALHQNCDLRRKGKSPREAVKIPAPESPKQKTEQKDAREPLQPSTHTPIDSSQRIFRIVKSNPRKEGTHGWNSFHLITDGMTIEEYIRAGGRKNDMNWDIDHKFIQLRGNDETPPAKVPAPAVQRDEEKKARPKAPKVVPAKKSPAVPVKKSKAQPAKKGLKKK